MEYLRRTRNMPWLKRGMRCDMDGKPGTVTGAGTYLHIRFDGQRHSVNCHPTWAMTFYDASGKVVADYKAG